MEYRHLWSHCTPTKQSPKNVFQSCDCYLMNTLQYGWMNSNTHWQSKKKDHRWVLNDVHDHMLNCYIFTHLFHHDWAGEFRYGNTLSVGHVRTKFVIQTPKLQNWYLCTQGAHQSSQWSLCRASSKNCMIFAQLCGALIHTEMTMKFMKMILGRAGLGISIILG